MTESAASPAGIPIRDQEVRLDVSADEALAAGQSQRTRLADLVASLTDDEWQRPSRCEGWTVQDVVRHLVHMSSMQLASIGAAQADERYEGFAAKAFNPRETPSAHLRELGDESPEVTAAAFADSTRDVLAALGSLAGTDVLVSTPIGRQPWHRAALHGLFDSAVHERDILAAVERPEHAAAPDDEMRAIASYQVLLVTRVLAFVGAPVDLALHLDGGPDLRVRIDAPVVSVSTGDVDGAALTARGECEAVLDAMVGRGKPLADVLDGPPEVAMGLSALSSLV